MTDEEQQLAREAELVSNVKVCNLATKSTIKDVDSMVLQAELGDGFFNASLLETLSCLFDMAIHTPQETPEEGLPVVNREIHDYLSSLRLVGTQGVEGYAMFSGLNGVKDIVFVKAPRDPDNDGLLHEYAVGVLALNRLRRVIPNFLYVLAGFQCSAPKIQGKAIKEWCNNTNSPVNYVIYELIPGDNLSEMLKTVTFEEFLSYFIQVCHALLVALEEADFTHCDLHFGNVRLRKIQSANEEWFYVPYRDNVYIYTNKVPVIIDYGRCHFKYNNESFGFFGMEREGILPHTSRPFYDIYKLLGFCLWGLMKEGNSAVLDRAASMMGFFGHSNLSGTVLRNFLKKGKDHYFELSAKVSPLERESSIQDFLAYVEELYPDEWGNLVVSQVADDDNVLSCAGVVQEEPSTCKGQQRIIQELTMQVVPASTYLAHKSKQSTAATVKDKIRTIRSTNKRLTTIQASKKNLDEDIEYNEIQSRNKYTKEDYVTMRNVLLDETRKLQVRIKRSYNLYPTTSFDDTIFDSAEENYKSLLQVYHDIRNYRTLLNLVRVYGRDIIELRRIQELGNMEVTPLNAFVLDDDIQSMLLETTNNLAAYLDSLTPLTERGIILRDGLRAAISWYL